jgi:hypothetical protein
MCNCIELSEKALIEHGDNNTALAIPIVFHTDGKEHPTRLTVGTEKRDPDKRQKPATIFASFCPFCGEKYEEPQP